MCLQRRNFLGVDSPCDTCCLGGHRLSVHVIIRFEPRPGEEAAFREELLRVNKPSRAEMGCLRIDVFESLREPLLFAVHSEWADEAAFELHATLPHTVQFLAAAGALLTHPVQGLRLRQIGGGAGAALERKPDPPVEKALSD
jgi:quinol monooxygenase YgiN